MTPPIDQRPSSFLLSFLQFVNFSKSLVDFGPAAQQFFLVGCAVASFGGIDASGLIHGRRRDLPTLFLEVSWSLCGNH